MGRMAKRKGKAPESENRASLRMTGLKVEIDGREVTPAEGVAVFAEAHNLPPSLLKAVAGTMLSFLGVPGGEELQQQGATEHAAELAEKFHRERRLKK